MYYENEMKIQISVPHFLALRMSTDLFVSPPRWAGNPPPLFEYLLVYIRGAVEGTTDDSSILPKSTEISRKISERQFHL